LAGERRTHPHRLEVGVGDRVQLLGLDGGAGPQLLAVGGLDEAAAVLDVVGQDTAEDAGPKVADLLAALVDHPDRDAAVGATVLFQDDHLLGDVDETTGQVAGVRGAESRVGQTLSGAVRGDEVLDRKSTRLNSSHVKISYAV